MKKALIAYFSQGGTTRSVGEQILKGLNEKQIQVDFYDITEGPIFDIKSYDIIGIGSPAYIFRPPFSVVEFIKSLPDLDGLSFFTFVMYGTKPGKTGNVIRNLLTIKGAKEIGYAKFKGADFWVGYLQRGYLFSPDNPNDNELEMAIYFGREIAANFSGDNYIKPDMDSGLGIVYTLL